MKQRKRHHTTKKAKARGKTLEAWINRGFVYLRKLGLVCIHIKADRKREKEPADFAVMAQNGIAWLFDAKETQSNTWYINCVESHQIDAISNAKRNGHRSGFVVYFAATSYPPGMMGNTRFIEAPFTKTKYNMLDGISFDFDTIMLDLLTWLWLGFDKKPILDGGVLVIVDTTNNDDNFFFVYNDKNETIVRCSFDEWYNKTTSSEQQTKSITPMPPPPSVWCEDTN